MIAPNIVLVPRRPALVQGFDNQLDLLVRVQAPQAPAAAAERSRPPLNLALVIDRSGSMSGAPLEAAKDCAHFIVDRLGPEDHLALVVYDNSVQVLMPAQRVTEKPAIHQVIRAITSGGSTDLHAGWLKGAEQVARVSGGKAISRVLLLSDGCANAGLTDIAAIAKQCAELAAAGVSTSTYGLGNGFNEELMIRMAAAGQGKSYYGESADDLRAPFEQEFDLLSSIHARKVTLALQVAPGIEAHVRNSYQRDAAGRVQLPDLVFGGESWALLQVRVPAAMTARGMAADAQSIALLSVQVECADRDGVMQPPLDASLALPAVPAAAHAALAEDSLVVSRVQEIEAAEIQDRAEQAARRGDWPEVQRSLVQARKNAEGNAWLAGCTGKLEALAAQRDMLSFAKESAFASNRMRTRTAQVNESADLSCEEALPAYLRRSTEQGKGTPKAP